jgi:NAD(P)-dependent dehydrogenase (short-subunit alcohol dehydrogenase family)
MAEATQSQQSLEGRRAIVTGGGSGIGAELVSQLVDGGAEVLAADIDASGLEAVAASTGASTMVVDVADGEGANMAMLAEAVAAFGGVDLVFLNAGILGRPIADQGSPYTVAALDASRYEGVPRERGALDAHRELHHAAQRLEVAELDLVGASAISLGSMPASPDSSRPSPSPSSSARGSTSSP